MVITVVLGTVHGDRPQEGHLAVGLTTYWNDSMVMCFQQQQHWLSSEMLGVRRLTVSSLVSAAHLGHETNDDDDDATLSNVRFGNDSKKLDQYINFCQSDA